MRVIGLTGSIACGKSTVSSWLREQPGCVVIDGDQLSRELTAKNGPALPTIRRRFGSTVFNPDGSLNRSELGRVVFASPDAREALDQLMAPLLEEKTEQSLTLAADCGAELCFLDFPLLYEKGYDRLCRSVWCVWLPPDLQLERLMTRDGMTREEALSRINAVLSSDDKAARSQVIIDNSGTLEETLAALPALLAEERRLAVSYSRRRRTVPSPDTDGSPLSDNNFSGPQARIPVHVNQPGLSSEEVPSGVMTRPAAARRENRRKKVLWMFPSWLIALLTVSFFLVLAGVASLAGMRAYLTRQTEKHQAEQNAIYANYPYDYRALIEEAAADYNLNPAFVAAIVRNESSFQPRAESSVGARGLMQLMPDTAEWIAGKLKFSGYAFERMYDPQSNLRFGCWYVNYLSSLFHGDPVSVACAYHAGQGQVTAWLSDPRLSDDGVSLVLSRMADGPTKTYAGRVIKAYGIYQALYYGDRLSSADGSAAALDVGESQQR